MADHFVIDGSNLATEGRTEPSLAQLREAVTAFTGEHPGSKVTVVVDASFEHRIDPKERPAFSKAEVANEVVSPPAGAVGRGDGFLLQIANRTDATVVSNDSFQEFHAEYEWLFEPGRLIGGKPVPGVGWIFSLRRPVRGIVSRKTTQRAKKEERVDKQVREAIAEATADALTNQTGGRRRRRGGRGGKPNAETTEPEAVNQPAPFLQFVIDHRLGTEVEGLVDSFSSHGAFVLVDDVRCYVPLGAMGEPRPTRARDVLTRGETRAFVVQAVDAPRRGVELALPGYAKVAGAPSDETVAAEVKGNRPKKAAAPKAPAPKAPAKSLAAASKSSARSVRGGGRSTASSGTGPATPVPTKPPPGRPASARKVAKKAAEPARKQAATPAKRAATTAKRAPAKAEPAKKAAKTVAKKAPATKQPAKKPTATAPAKKTTRTTKQAAPSAKKQAPAKRAAAKAEPAKKAAKTVAKKAPAAKQPAKKAAKGGRR
jgi:hypothetical protein